MGEMWSRPILRKHATSNGKFSTRWYLSAWLETSMTMDWRPDSRQLAIWRQTSGASGVVLVLS